jgi:hypothetical protein
MFRNFRVDIVIALCALLVSTLATAASWYQTRVIQQQLSAQVWPYLTVTEDISGDLFSLSIENDGLGPAVIRNLSASVDHRPVGNYLDLMHAILGPNIVRRKPRGEKMAMYQNSLSPGDVLRAGQSLQALGLKSRHFSRLLLAGYHRTDFGMCYCAILPGTCWYKDIASNADPKPVGACPELPHDLLHAGADTALTQDF